jgi:hypothetical protein
LTVPTQVIVPVSPWLVDVTLCDAVLMPGEKLRGDITKQEAVLPLALKAGDAGIKTRRTSVARPKRNDFISLTSPMRA